MTLPLLLRAAGDCELDPARLVEVFADQRRRLLADLRVFGPDDWAAPSRCAEWSAHDVVRHLCDGTPVLAAGPDDHTLDQHAGFDPRTTPHRWLDASAGESPAATLDRLAATTEAALAAARDRLAVGDRYDVRLLDRTVDWTVRALHLFWDSWLHERDVFLPRGVERAVDDDGTRYAVAYGLFLAGTVAGRSGQGHYRLVLGGPGGGAFDLDTRRPATLTVTPLPATGPAGPLAAEVADAVAGRGPGAVLDGLPPALTRLARFFTTPVAAPA